MSAGEARPLARVVVKEEFVALTGDFVKAAILGEIEYWQKRVRDVDRYIREERRRAEASGDDYEVNIDESGGWIYKSVEELSEETMLHLAKNTMLRHMKPLIENGWLLDRNNPRHKWDRTKQYRLNLLKIRDDLKTLGYELQEWVLEGDQGAENGTDDEAEQNVTTESANSEHRGANLELRRSDMELQRRQNGTAIPDITTDTTYSSSRESSADGDASVDLAALPDDPTAACLLLLSRVKGFPRNQAENALYLAELRTEFPGVDPRKTVREYQIWHRDNPGKTRNYRGRLRNFFEKAAVDAGLASSAVGAHGATGGTPAAGVEALRNYVHPKGGPNDLRRFAGVAERFDFSASEATDPDWRIMRELDDDPMILKRIRSVVQRAMNESAVG